MGFREYSELYTYVIGIIEDQVEEKAVEFINKHLTEKLSPNYDLDTKLEKIINYKTNSILKLATGVYAGDLDDEKFNGEVSLVYTGTKEGSWYKLNFNDIDFCVKDGENGGYDYAGMWYDDNIVDSETIK